MNPKLPSITLALKIISFLIGSWLLVHFMAIFGLFLVFTYPVWHLLFPQRIPCFYCHLTGYRSTKPSDSSIDTSVYKSCHHSVIRQIVLNSILLFAITVLSMTLVFFESRVLFRLGFPPTPKTVFFVIPSKGQYHLGEIFPLRIEIANIKIPVNAVQADISFDPAKLQVIDISTNKSFADVFIQKEINNDIGYARLSGGLPDPGFFDSRGLFGTIFFQGLIPGLVTVEFLPTSMVLANDGRGTNTLKNFSSISYLILPEAITPDEEELQKEVYLEKKILGEQSSLSQLHLYPEESDSLQVLGASNLEKEISQSQKFRPLELIWSLIEKLDRFTLLFWHQILDLLGISYR